MCSHVPNKGEQMVRYYGYYSDVSRGKRKKNDHDGLIPCILEPDDSSKGYRKNWARLIQKIYEVDPLTYPKCLVKMKIISVIEDKEIIDLPVVFRAASPCLQSFWPNCQMRLNSLWYGNPHGNHNWPHVE